MANNTKNNTTTKAKAKPAVKAEKPTEDKEKIVFAKTKEIDLHQPITVYNGFQGILVYKSPRTGEVYEWNGFGDAQELELQELRTAKASRKGFFTQNWFMFDDADMWVIDFLGVGQYYADAVSVDDFDAIFQMEPQRASAIISGMTDGQRKSAEYRARQLVGDGTIDSRKMIKALEIAFGAELEER